MTKNLTIDYDAWLTVCNSLRQHLIAAEDPRQAIEISKELRLWLELEPANQPAAPAEAKA